MNDIKQKILKLANQVAGDQGLEIFNIEILGKGKVLLKVTLNKETGVTLEDCERFSKSFGALLDVEDPVPCPYTLEVSSPGLDRPIRSLKDFEENTGKLARIITSEKIESQNFFIGKIIKTNNNSINLLVKDREIIIPFDKISKAKLEVELKCRKSSPM
ncbi:MAG: ribosome maturation factor RimP [Nitrospirota bacterium]